MAFDIDKFYRDGGFGYHKNQRYWEQWCSTHIIKKEDKNHTLLDAGCGDGFWSFVLAPHFLDTMGVEISKGGIEMANIRKARQKISNVNFKVGDALEVKEPYDVVFCRAPSFFNYPSPDEKFIEGLEKMLSICKKRLIFVAYTKPPFGTWSAGNSSYFHHPKTVETTFKKYGNTNVKYASDSKYVIAQIQI